MIDIFNKLSDDIIIIDVKGKVIFLNNRLLFKLGYKKNEIENKEIIDLLKDNEICKSILNYSNNKSLDRKNLNIYSKSNEVIKYEFSLSLDNYNGQEVIFIICNEVKEEVYTKENLESFIDNLPFMCVMKDVDGKYVFANKFVLKSLEEKRENVVGKYDKDIFNEQSISKALSEDKQVIETKENLTIEKYVQKESGYKRWFRIHKMPVLDEMKNVKYVGSLSYDISLRKNIEVELDNSLEKVLSLNNNDIDEGYDRLDFIQNMLIKNLDADGINVWIYNEDNSEMVSNFRWGITHDIVGEKSSIKFDSKTFARFILNDNFEGIKPINKRYSNPLIKDLIKYEVKYQGLYKISFNNKVVGLLSVVYKNEPDFSKEDYIKNMCNEMGMIIKNYSLYCELRKEVYKRIQIEKKLEEFLNIATDILTVIDEDGNFIKINNEASNLLGWSKEELLNIRWQNIICPEYVQITLDSVEEAKKEPGVVKRIINRYISKSGELIWLDWRYKYLEESKILMCTAKNITEEKKMQEQKDLYEKSLELESIKNEFFSNISHEFKTPLNIILATMQLINRSIENNEITVTGALNLKKYVGSIKQNSYRLLRLVNNLIDMTRIDTGYYNINLENNNIVSIVEDITMSVAQYVEDKGISLIFDTEVEEEIIACDPDKIERIMLNLLSNAIKYTSCDGEINVYLSKSNNNVVVSVKDDGIGIPTEKLATIFDRFVQVDNQLTRKCQGSGIGLSLVKSLVELHGGTIIAKSEEGKGTEFIFELPIRTIESHNEIKISENTINSKIEKCNIEFSDIYN